MSDKPNNGARKVEVYEMSEGLFALIITADDGSADDATSRWIKANGKFQYFLKVNGDGF